VKLIDVGLMAYEPALTLQQDFAADVASGIGIDTLMLVEHPRTYTLGRSGHLNNLLLSADECQKRGIDVVHTDRGGDITYHGPGQIVAYPIMILGKPSQEGRLLKVDYVGYIRKLEEVIIQTLRKFNVYGYQIEGLSGVWTGSPIAPRKIAAIGVKVNSKGISTHGFALNVNTDLSYFEGIIPCGITGKGVTSMEALLGDDAPDCSQVKKVVCKSFEQVFDVVLSEQPLGELHQQPSQHE
jgi:lipoate-protein ligase B